ncbi:MAG: hypothetical protein ACFFDY_01310 [Candidatus Thorarchaeota archaeon]
MANVTIQVELKQTQALLDAIYHGGPGVLTRAINNTLNGVKTDVSNEIVADVNLTKTFLNKQTGKDAEKTFVFSYASSLKLWGSISTKSANVPLIQYSNQRGNKASFAKKVYVTIQRNRGKTLLAHAFRMTMPSGHVGLFEIEQPPRTSRTGRSVIKQLYGSRIPDVLSNKATFDRVQEKANARLDKQLASQIDYMLSRL